MTLWRYLQDESLGFPRPFYIRKRRYFWVDELESWKAARAEAAA